MIKETVKSHKQPKNHNQGSICQKKQVRNQNCSQSSTAPNAVQTKCIGLKACPSFGQFGTATTAVTEDQSSWKTATWQKNFRQTGKQKTKTNKNLKNNRSTSVTGLVKKL
jgi:hypothetical protein